MRTCTCIYHFLVLNWYIFLNYYIPRHGNEQKEYKIFQDGAQWKYLTLLNLFVFLVFWTIFLYDRELVYPKILDEIFPIWMNHAMHTFILPFSLLEVILRPHHYPSKKTGITLLAAGTVAYTARGPWALVATDNHQQVPHTVDTHGDAAGRWQWASCQVCRFGWSNEGNGGVGMSTGPAGKSSHTSQASACVGFILNKWK
ncbi:androgen-dependent TFPI-regulating protein isoform X4 [Marmota marmota marmota]|uniref:androgen-dependent TFPI-regulating protein isoform X4 n=1 Tax=Marmota marmota marmota TaxID=9994 RepID=UPI00209305A9|nr:androgen-dependent TFPI-regulating protein isoform X4 [Marmota marmota marmota]